MELKPCPFCGGNASVRLYVKGRYAVHCNVCDAHMELADSKEEAIGDWNERAPLGEREPCKDTNEDEHDFTCSECGASMYTQVDDCWTMIGPGGLTKDVIERPNYCPNCGRKVAD